MVKTSFNDNDFHEFIICNRKFIDFSIAENQIFELSDTSLIACVNLLFCAIENVGFGLEEEKLKLLINLIKKINMKNILQKETYKYLVSKLSSITHSNTPDLDTSLPHTISQSTQKNKLHYRKSFLVSSNQHNVRNSNASIISEDHIRIILLDVKYYMTIRNLFVF